MRSIPHGWRLALLALVAVVAGIGLTSCDPSDPVQYRQWLDLNPVEGRYVTAETMNEPQRAVVSHLQDQQLRYLAAVHAAEQAASTDCIGAMHAVFPSSVWSWAEGIIRRESGNTPTADNPTSSAAGCWQMLAMHDWRYYEVGCTPAQKYQALCNNKAAYHLYRSAGTSPWRL